MVVSHKQYDPIQMYEPCPTSPVSKWIIVPNGYHVQFKLFQIPTDFCLTFEEVVCPCCCKLVNFPLCDDCGCELAMGLGPNDDRIICLPAGRYEATLLDEDGDPTVPGELEVILQANILPGNCPTQD